MIATNPSRLHRRLGSAIAFPAVGAILYLVITYGLDWLGLNPLGAPLLAVRLLGASLCGLVIHGLIWLVKRADARALLVFAGWLVYLGAWLASLWPGLVMSDSYSAYLYGLRFPIDDWLGYSTVVGYATMLQLVPKFWFIAACQIALAAAVLAYADWALCRRSTLACVLVHGSLLICVPFIANTMLLSRDVPFAFLNVALAVNIFAFLRGLHGRGRPTAIWLGAICAALVLTRSDGLPPAMVALTAALFAGRLDARTTLLTFLTPILVIGVALPHLTGKASNSYGYNVSLTLNPLGFILQQDFRSPDQHALLAKIDKVVSVESVINDSRSEEIPVFWSGKVKYDVSDEDRAEYFRAFRGLVLDNPSLFIESRVRTFMHSTGLAPPTLTFVDADMAGNWDSLDRKTFSDARPISRPIAAMKNFGIERLRVRAWLESTSRYEGLRPLGSALFWNFLPELLILCLVLFANRWVPVSSIAALVLLTRVPAVFFLAPGGHFKYYLPIELSGFIVLAMALTELSEARKQRAIRSPQPDL